MAQGSGRRRRKQRRRQSEGGAPSGVPAAGNGSAADADSTSPGAASPGAGAMSRGYSRSRAKDDAARAALKPLKEGERPTAVTVGAIFAAVAMIANLVAMIAQYDPDEQRKNIGTLVGTLLLTSLTIGMWRARYWAVLGMQTLLLFTIILSSLALLTAVNIAAGILAFALVIGSSVLFWFLIKAMARIQMPTR